VQTCALLHVEDEDASACLFRTALDRAHIVVSVYRVSDGEQAMAFLNQSGMYQLGVAPNSFVLDLNMPRVDGWTVLLKIRASDVLQKIPVVVLSTSAEPEDQERALLLGARRYVVKPPDFDGLVRDVKWICASFLPLPA
jgi:two-component system, chemotaxis family, response regulator Rcp1